jgi:hypothetical protein
VIAMTRSKLLFVATGLAALALASCGGGKGGMAVTTPPPTAPPRLEDQFGAGFGMAFRQDRNTEPADPAAADIEAVTLTAEPRDVS